jgi:DNA-directed RNA polymerase sigma subunit (sigma70/sigma32)
MRKLKGKEQNIIELYDRKFTLEEIGRMYGVSRQAVQQLLIANGIARRSTGRKKKEESQLQGDRVQVPIALE